MPGYDGTGPQGVGPNGGRFGPCGRGEFTEGRFFSRLRRGGRGGVGRGYRWLIQTHQDEKSQLKNEEQMLRQQLEVITDRLEALGEE
jgi:hypothetical protein